MPTLIFSRVGACPSCSPRAGAHAYNWDLTILIDKDYNEACYMVTQNHKIKQDNEQWIIEIIIINNNEKALRGDVNTERWL